MLVLVFVGCLAHPSTAGAPVELLLLLLLQDCFGGCTDPSQGFYGTIDEVRLWKVVRSQDDLLKHMRWASGLENHEHLSAYWKFNDPDDDSGQFR
jgi:hypothetical protein